jgi:hypothetical protein
MIQVQRILFSYLQTHLQLEGIELNHTVSSLKKHAVEGVKKGTVRNNRFKKKLRFFTGLSRKSKYKDCHLKCGGIGVTGLGLHLSI